MTQVGEAFVTIRPDTKNFGAEAEKNIRGALEPVFSSLASAGQAVASSIGIAAGAATAFGIAATFTAARASEMDVILAQLARTNGLNATEVDGYVKAVRAQGIELGVAQSTVATFIRSQLNLADATKIARIAQDAATLAGVNSSEALDGIIHGIQTQQVEILRQSGILVDAKQAFEVYGKAIGKAAADLTPFEKQQAFVNAVIAQGATIAGSYEAAMTNASKVLRSMPRLLNDIAVNVGQSFLPLFKDLVFTAYDSAKALVAMTDVGTPLRSILDGIGAVLSRLLAPLGEASKRAIAFLQAISTDQAAAFLATLDRWAPVLAAAAAGFLAMGAKSVPVLGQMLGGLNPVIAALGALVLASPELRTVLGDALQKVLPPLVELAQTFAAALVPALVRLLPPLIEITTTLIIMFVPILMRLTPVLLAVANALADALLWISKNDTAMRALAVVIGSVLVASVIAYTYAMTQAAIATIAATWPFLALVAVIAEVTATTIFFYKNWDEIWKWIQNHPAYAAVIFILGQIFLPFIIGAAIIGAFATNWDSIWAWIKQAASDAWVFLRDEVWHPLEDGLGVIRDILQTIGDIAATTWGNLKSAVSDMWDVVGPILNSMKSVANEIIDALHSLGKLTDNGIGGGGPFAIDPGRLGGGIFGFASGGVVPGPAGAAQLAVVHGGETIRNPGQEAALGSGVQIVNNFQFDGVTDEATARRMMGAVEPDVTRLVISAVRSA